MPEKPPTSMISVYFRFSCLLICVLFKRTEFVTFSLLGEGEGGFFLFMCCHTWKMSRTFSPQPFLFTIGCDCGFCASPFHRSHVTQAGHCNFFLLSFYFFIFSLVCSVWCTFSVFFFSFLHSSSASVQFFFVVGTSIMCPGLDDP